MPSVHLTIRFRPEDTCPPGPRPTFTYRHPIFKHLKPKNKTKLNIFQAQSKNPSLVVVWIRLSKRNRFMNEEMLDCHGDTVPGQFQNLLIFIKFIPFLVVMITNDLGLNLSLN